MSGNGRGHVMLAPTRASERSDSLTLTSAFLLFPALAAAALLAMLPWYAEMDGSQVLLSALHVLACVAGATLATAGGLRPCLLIASVFPFCWLVVPAAYQISHTQAAWGDAGVTLQADATLRSQAVLLVAQMGLLTAYAVADRLVGTRTRPAGSARSEGREFSRRRAAATASILLLATAALLPLVVSAAGGLGAFFSSRQGFTEALASNGYTDNASPLSALATLVPGALATVATLLGVHLFKTREREDPAQVRVALAISLTGVAFLSVVANPLAFSRFIFLTCFGPVALVLLRPTSRRAALAWLSGTLVAFLFAYPAADLLRLEDNQAPADITAQILASKDYDGFQQTINTITYVDDTGVTHGVHLASGLLFFVPRDFWSGKALPASIEIAENRGYTFTNLSLPLPAEGYLDAGWWGAVAVAFILGSLLAVLDRSWRAGSSWAMVSAYLAMAQVGLWRGPFGSQMPVFAFAAAVLVLVVWFMTHQRRHGHGEGMPTPKDVPAGRHQSVDQAEPALDVAATRRPRHAADITSGQR